MSKETVCPVCDANVPVDPEVKEGDFIYCGFCMAQLRVTREIIEEDDKKSKVEVEEDWG